MEYSQSHSNEWDGWCLSTSQRARLERGELVTESEVLGMADGGQRDLRISRVRREATCDDPPRILYVREDLYGARPA